MPHQSEYRRSDGKNLPNRSVPFYVPGKSGEVDRHRRDSARYTSSGRRASAGRHSSALNGTVFGEPSVRPVRVGLLAFLVFLFVCVIALVGFVIANNVGPQANTHDRSAESLQAVEAAERVIAGADAVNKTGLLSAASKSAESVAEIQPSAVLSIPGSQEIVSLRLDGENVSSGNLLLNTTEIMSAVSAIREYDAQCGFVFFDLDTGRGLAYNADEAMYVASAAKAPFVFWLLTSGVESDEYDREEIQWVVEESDNESFEDLFFRYYENGYEDYMASHDVVHDDYYYDFYPLMNARSLASVWIDIYQYMREGSDDAVWLAGLMGVTSTSFIRDALYGSSVVVMDKAGWIGEEGYASVSDAGIIADGDHTYIMVIVTSQFDDEVSEQNITALARALYDVRDKM